MNQQLGTCHRPLAANASYQGTHHANLAGLSQPKPKPIGYDDDFATLPGATPSQQAAPAVSASGEAASAAAAAAAGSNGLVWDKAQALALHNYVASLLDLQGGREDNPSMWQDVAAKSDLWGGCRPTASELKHVYDQVIAGQAERRCARTAFFMGILLHAPCNGQAHVAGCFAVMGLPTMLHTEQAVQVSNDLWTLVKKRQTTRVTVRQQTYATASNFVTGFYVIVQKHKNVGCS